MMMIRNNVTSTATNPNLLQFNHHALLEPTVSLLASSLSLSSLNRSHHPKFDHQISDLGLNNMLALLNDSFSLNYNNLSVINSFKNTTSVNPTEEDSYSLELWQRVFWSTVFSLMVIIAFLGNSGVIMIVLLNKQMRTVTNMFIVNLSIADLLVSSGNVIFNFVYMLNGHWLFGRTYCKISNFIAILSVACSCFTLMAISVDRFIAIVYPLKPRMSLMTALNITIGIWTASSLLSLPNFIFSTTESESMPDGSIRIMCLIRYPDGVAPDSLFDYYYNLAVLILTYFLPITLMTLTYFRVATVLWGSKTIGECSSKQAQSIKSKRKIVKMMVLVLTSFAVLWLPYHIYFILQHHMPEITKVKHAQHIFLTLYWLAMSTSMLNPPIYCWLNSRFRSGFKNALFCEYCKGETDEREDQRKNHLRACYLKQWPSSSEPQSTSESTTQKFKCSSSASSQWCSTSGQRELGNFSQVLTVYPNNHLPNNHFSSRLSTSASTNANQSIRQLNDTTSLTNSDQLMMILTDHKSPIKVCISKEISNPELNNNTILHIKELNSSNSSDQMNDKYSKTDHRVEHTTTTQPTNNQASHTVSHSTTITKIERRFPDKRASKFTSSSSKDAEEKSSSNHIINNRTDELDQVNENLKQYKHQAMKQKKFAISASQLNKPLSTSQSFSTSVCLKKNFEMSIEPSSSCSSVYSKKSQVDQV